MSLPSPAFVAPVLTGTAVAASNRRRITAAALDRLRPLLPTDERLIVDLPTGPVVIAVVNVGPDMAHEWLTTYNTRNRNLSDNQSGALSRDMENGNWLFSGDTVRFSVYQEGPLTGETYLADGQHRLDGIRKSGTTQLCLVVTGLPEAAQEVMDTQKVRTFGDTLKLRGWTDGNHVSAITRVLLLWERGITVGINSGGTATSIATKPELSRYLDAHEAEVRGAIKVVHAMTSTGLKFATASSKMAAAWVLFNRKDPEAASLFVVEHVVQGKRLDDGHPAKALRDRLLRTDVYRPSPGEAFLLTLHAWNIWRENRTVTKLQAPRSGWPSPEDFPIK